MKIQGTYLFDAPLPIVWQALFEPEVLAKTLPGCEKLEREGNQFKGEINVKMGPVQGKFQGKVDLTDVKELSSYKMLIDGRGPAGFVKATAELLLRPDTAGTRLDYDSDVQVGGRIASVGQRLLDASSRAIVKQSLEGLHEQIKLLAARALPAEETSSEDFQPFAPRAVDPLPAREPAAAAQAASSEWFKPEQLANKPAGAKSGARGPSQAAFAMGVAKEVTKELLPIRTILLVLGLLVLGWAIYRGVSSG
jgi:carbon monoxide dehydrogenase subunit G